MNSIPGERETKSSMARRETLTFRRFKQAGSSHLDYRLTAIALAPVLVAQGLSVRRKALRMPEPPGPRSGTVGDGEPLSLLIAGDSAAAGVGAPSQAEGLSGAVTAALAERYRVSWTVKARTGLRTGHVLARLEAEGVTADPPRYDVALTSLGVNDVTGGTRSHVFVAQQRRMVRLLRDRYGVRLAVLTGLPPMHVFPALPQPLRAVLGARAMAFTRLLETVAAAEPGCEVLSPDLPLELAYIAEDGFHPGPPAYAKWGREAADLIVRRLG